MAVGIVRPFTSREANGRSNRDELIYEAINVEFQYQGMLDDVQLDMRSGIKTLHAGSLRSQAVLICDDPTWTIAFTTQMIHNNLL
jgi:hypothetical protein